jgi:hypothetical protein
MSQRIFGPFLAAAGRRARQSTALETAMCQLRSSAKARSDRAGSVEDRVGGERDHLAFTRISKVDLSVILAKMNILFRCYFSMK